MKQVKPPAADLSPVTPQEKVVSSLWKRSTRLPSPVRKGKIQAIWTCALPGFCLPGAEVSSEYAETRWEVG